MSDLTEALYHELIDRLQIQVEDILDGSGLEVDLENAAGVLSVRFANASQLILSRQPALRQLWIAARSGGFHLDYQAEGWFCSSTQESLGTLLKRVTAEQGGVALEFPGL